VHSVSCRVPAPPNRSNPFRSRSCPLSPPRGVLWRPSGCLLPTNKPHFAPTLREQQCTAGEPQVDQR
jgi:hypothetical protein